MRVAFDAYWWIAGPQSMANVLHGVVETWSQDFPDDELVLVVRSRHSQRLGELPANVTLYTTRLWPQALVAALAVPIVAWRKQADAMMTHSFAPLFGKRRSVLLHDAMYMTSPQWFTRTELAYFRWMARLARRAHIVFATSETEARRITDSTSARVVAPVGMGIGAELLEGAEDPDETLTPGEFILVVGRLNVRKNLFNTLEGVRESGVLAPELPTVIVGERQGVVADLPTWVEEAENSGAVRFPGVVSNARLGWLLKNCALFVSLSLDEGFGLPPVEASALGALVLVSDRPIFHETLDGQAEFVDPLDIHAIGQKIRSLQAAQWSVPTVDRSGGNRIATRYNWSQVVQNVRSELLRISS